MAGYAIDLFCGLGGWTDGLLAAGWDVIGFDIERHRDAAGRGYPAQLVLQDVHTIDGRQFRDAGLIVASPPCQAYSYMAMPWARAKAVAAALRGHGEFPERYSGPRTIEALTALWRACERIQAEACAAAGRRIPLVIENVRGAQPWIGRAAWRTGAFYLWGDVPALMPDGGGRKVGGFNFHEFERTGKPGRSFQTASVTHTASRSRKEAAAAVAKIPFELARHIGEVYRPDSEIGAANSHRAKRPASNLVNAQLPNYPTT